MKKFEDIFISSDIKFYCNMKDRVVILVRIVE